MTQLREGKGRPKRTALGVYLSFALAVLLVSFCYLIAPARRGPLVDHAFDALMLPGWLLTVYATPQGIHSDRDVWTISAIVNVLIYGLLFFFGWRIVRRVRTR